MTDHDYEATVETEDATFTFSGDKARVVSGQAARMPVQMHLEQLNQKIELDVPVFRYLEEQAKKEQEKSKNEAEELIRKSQ